MKIADVLNKKGHDFRTIAPDQDFASVVKALVGFGIGSLIVTDIRGKPVGVVTERSIVYALAGLGGRAFSRHAREIMQSPVPSCQASDSIRAAMAKMTTLRTRHLVVQDGTKTHGVVSLGDLVKFRLEDTELENSVLRDIAGARSLARS